MIHLSEKMIVIDFPFKIADHQFLGEQDTIAGDMKDKSLYLKIAKGSADVTVWGGEKPVLITLKAVKDKELDFDLYVGACVMEEVGQRGATTATGLVKPDLGVVLGCKKAKTLDEKDQSVGELGKGLLVSFYDKGMMPNRGLLDALVQICKEEDIAYQHYYSMDLNEGAWVHKLFAGCPTLNVSIAIQNAYSAIESMDLNDYDCAKKALTVFVEHLNEEKIQEFKESNR